MLVKGATSVTRWIAFLAISTIGTIAPSDAADPSPRSSRSEAEWISCADSDSPNSWISFRHRFVTTDSAGPASVRIACDSKYWLWINGELVVFEGQLKRGPTPESTYFDRIDLSGRFRDGENTIAVLIWHYGRDGMSHKNSGRAGLLFDGRVGEQPVVGNDSWRARRHPAYYSTKKPNPNWRLPEANVAFDARLDLIDWTKPAYDDSDWPAAIELGKPPTAPWGELIERPVPMWKSRASQAYAGLPEMPFVSDGTPVVCKLPYNSQITPTFHIDSVPGKKIDIRTDNYRGGSELNVRAEYLTREGEQNYESLGWMNGHEVIYTIPPGVRVLGLGYRETGYDTELAGRFECSDERLNTLWKKAQRTLYLSMRDGYADCPGRERAQWWGDITLALQQAFYGLDRRADPLARKAILELVDWQKSDGALFSPMPAGNWDKELPTQMLASVGRYGFWEYYRHTGDRQTIERVYPGVNRYLELWRVGDDGLVLPRKGGWTWGDWGKNQDMPLLFNAWYYLALDGRRQMAEMLGDAEQAARDKATCQALAISFNQAFWTDRGYRSKSHQGPTDDRGNALAVVSGIANAERTEKIRRVFRESRQASPYMEKYVLEALFCLDATDQALDRMLERYDSMIDSPLTTLWEGWGIGSEGYGGGSYNHVWSGGVLTLLSQYVAGIDPLEPGYGRIAIKPQLGRLQHAAATVQTPRGELRVRHERLADGYRLQLNSPVGVECVVTLPRSEGQTLRVNGTPAKLIGSQPDKVSCLVPAGEHTMTVQ